MKKFLILLFSFVFLLVVFEACNVSSPTGSISIISVTPNSGLVDGNLTDFIVEVNYELSNTSQGELCVGFNTLSIDSYYLISSATVIINEGSGQHTFNINVTPIDWSTGDFKAYVNISEYPHGSPWTPLDYDTMILTF